MRQILLIGVNITTGQNQFVNAGNKAFGIVRVVAIICSVAALMLIGIKYMFASVEEKADYKKTFIVYIIGVVLAFGTAGLAEVVYNWISSI